MKRYLCLEEDRALLIRVPSAGLGRRRAAQRMDWEELEAGEEAEGVERLVRRLGLEGKRVELILESGVEGMEMALPEGSREERSRMAEHQLLAADHGKSAFVTAVERQPGNPNRCLVYYIERERISRILRMLRRNRLRCTAVRAYEACLTACAGRRWPEETILLMVPQRNRIKRLIVQKGRSLSLGSSSLRPAAFLKRDAEPLLWEELADLAEEARRKAWPAPISRVLVDTGHLPLQGAGQDFFMEAMKESVCQCCDFKALFCGADQRRPKRRGLGRDAGRPACFQGEGVPGSHTGSLRRWALLLGCNLIGAVLVSGALFFTQRQAEQEASYYRALEKLGAQMAAAKPLSQDFGVFSDEITEAAEIERIHYDGAGKTIAYTVRLPSPEELFTAEERLRASGYFENVSCIRWEQEADGRCLAVILAEAAEKDGEV